MYNILICDDDRDIVSALDIYLTSDGYQTFHAYDGLEALQMVKEHDIHLILMDIMMPGMDGIRTTAKLRETENIPIIFLTAKSEDADKILGLNIGADDYVTKPFTALQPDDELPQPDDLDRRVAELRRGVPPHEKRRLPRRHELVVGPDPVSYTHLDVYKRQLDA